MPENVIRVANWKNRRNDFEVRRGSDFLHALDVAEVTRVHIAKLGKLRVRQQHVRVTSLAGALEKHFQLVDVLVHPKVLRAVEPLFES